MHNPFWIDFIKSVKELWQSKLAVHRDVIFENPIRCNPSLQIDLRRVWYNKRMTVIGDIFNSLGRPLELEIVNSKLYLKVTFLDCMFQNQRFLKK